MKPAEQDNKPGITFSQAAARRLEYGPNELPERKPPGLSVILQVEPVTLLQWAQLLMIALILIVVDELHKHALQGTQSQL